MPCGRVLTAEIKKRIRELADRGLTAGEIAGALHINTDTVRKYLDVKKEVKNVVRKSIKNIGSEKTDRKRGAGDPGDSLSEKGGREPEHHTPDDHAAGKTISFTGRKKHGGSETMNKEKEESFEWECPTCHHQWNGSAAECPKCHKLLQE